MKQFQFFKFLYLEGNQLSTLPKNFFTDFPNLKWLDVSQKAKNFDSFYFNN